MSTLYVGTLRRVKRKKQDAPVWHRQCPVEEPGSESTAFRKQHWVPHCLPPTRVSVPSLSWAGMSSVAQGQTSPFFIINTTTNTYFSFMSQSMAAGQLLQLCSTWFSIQLKEQPHPSPTYLLSNSKFNQQLPLWKSQNNSVQTQVVHTVPKTPKFIK